MGRRKAPGLFKRGGIWHVDKRVRGRRICQSTRTADFEDAERFVARLIETDRQAHIYGVRPSRSFEQAAAKFVLENQHKRSLDKDIGLLKQLMPWIGHLPLERIHRGVLQALCGCSAGSGSHGRHYQSRFEDREAGAEPRSPGVDGRVRFDLAGIGTEGEAAAGHQQASALSACCRGRKSASFWMRRRG